MNTPRSVTRKAEKMRIIVVDDQEEECYLAETLLKGSGYEVETAANGIEALEKLRAGDFDMIISDVLMPVMDGFRLCRECKEDEKLKDIPFVFYTASYKDEGDEELASKLGADKFVRKPTEPKEFVKIIQGLFRGVEEGKIGPKKRVVEEDKEVLELYSERLIAKLEKKTLDLEAEIAQRKRAEEELRESEQRFRAVFDNAGDGILLVDTETRKLYSGNEMICRMLGYSPEELKDLGVRDIHPEKDLPYVIEQLEKRSREETTLAMDIPVKRRDGTVFYCDINSAPMNVAGKSYLLRIFRDITERKKAQQRLEGAFIDLTETVSRTMEARDPHTSGHQRRVAELARLVGEKLGLSADRLQGLYVGALLHDIGKIWVPESILAKPGKLSDEEWSLVQVHTRRGHEILKDNVLPWPVADMALHHQERLDGSGYPDGLSGDELSLEVRILGVCDVAEAMTSHRPYRPARNREEVLAEIKGGKGTKYDPGVVDAMLEMIDCGALEPGWTKERIRAAMTSGIGIEVVEKRKGPK